MSKNCNNNTTHMTVNTLQHEHDLGYVLAVMESYCDVLWCLEDSLDVRQKTWQLLFDRFVPHYEVECHDFYCGRVDHNDNPQRGTWWCLDVHWEQLYEVGSHFEHQVWMAMGWEFFTLTLDHLINLSLTSHQHHSSLDLIDHFFPLALYVFYDIISYFLLQLLVGYYNNNEYKIDLYQTL